MPKFEKHLFICTHDRPASEPRGCCKAKGAEKIRDYFKAEIKKRGLQGEIRANASGCLDHCEKGPTVVIYPEAVWYQVNTEEDAREIIEQHLLEGKVVSRLAIYPEET